MSTTKAPLRVLVTGAAGQIAYSLIPLIASGRVGLSLLLRVLGGFNKAM